MKTKLKFVLPALVFLFTVGGFIYLKSTKPVIKPADTAEKVWPVNFVLAKRTKEQPIIKEFGTVVAGSVVELRSLVDGRIIDVGGKFLEGGPVKKGDALIFIDRFDYKLEVVDKKAALREALARLKEINAEIQTQRSMLRISKAQLKLRKVDFDRKQNLSAKGTLSRKSRDDAGISLNDARQAVEKHRQTIDRLSARIEQSSAAVARSKAAVKKAERNLIETVLLAPEAGYLADTSAAAGQLVTKNDRLARLIVNRRLEVFFQLSRSAFGRLSMNQSIDGEYKLVGRPVIIKWRVGKKTSIYNGVIARLEPEINTATGGVGVFARINTPEGFNFLRPGAFIEVEIPDQTYNNVIRLPERAVGPDGELYIIENERLKQKKSEILYQGGSFVLVRTEIPSGTQIVITRFPEIAPGLRVSVQ